MSNLKKSVKFIVIIAVLAAAIGFTVILRGVFAGDGSTQATVAGDRNAQGSNNFGIPDKGGSAQQATGAKQRATGTGTGSVTAVSQNAEATSNVAETADAIAPAENTNANQDEQAVTTLVENFGKKLQMVSLLAPKEIAARTIKENYGDFATSGLLQKWMADPESAPGRTVSSPWPDRIDIFNLEPVDSDQYIVSGEIIEVTSTELVNGGAAARRPIELKVQKVDGRWLISSVTLGKYAERGPVKYENKKYGFDIYLPKSWEGYTIVEGKWEGRNGGNLIETGPQLLIRNPAWTEKDPHQDIPVMIFTTEQWNELQNEKFFVSAAPIGPSKLGSNSKYVFALPPRYNYAFPTGYEEVEKIMNSRPLWPFTPNPDNC